MNLILGENELMYSAHGISNEGAKYPWIKVHKRCTSKREETKRKGRASLEKGIVSYCVEERERERGREFSWRSLYNSLSRLFREAERFKRLVKVFVRIFVNISIRVGIIKSGKEIIILSMPIRTFQFY